MEQKPSTARSNLEQLLVDKTAEPKALPLSLLKDITGDFCNDQVIGSGGFAVVYKGILGDRVVAVKKLTDAFMDENIFHREVECLMLVKHKNVVRFLGYCADRQGNMERYDGKLVMADLHQRLLCFEYIPKGSLHKYITEAHREWRMCYKIIKGICEGLQNLHDNRIVHLDLKPANILLDENMAPKITDFGLSRCFNENQSRDLTKTIFGTIGYMAPELREGGIIARSCDIYSLGVIIIEILTGQKVYQATKDVLESWRGRLERSQQETLCEQIRVCYETALECIAFNPVKRPASARNIIHRLHQMESNQKKNSDKGGGVGEQKKKSDKGRRVGEQKKKSDKGRGVGELKKKSDKGGGGSEQKNNPDKDGGGKEQNKNADKGGGSDRQKKNPDKGGGGNEQKKNPDKGGGTRERKKNPDKGGGQADKVDKISPQSQPKEDKEKKQPPVETKPTMYPPLRSVHIVLPSAPAPAPAPAPREETRVLLRISLHCDGCVERIVRRIHKIKGVVDVMVEDFAKNEVKVMGTIDAAHLAVYLKERQRHTRPVEPGKKDDKKDKGGSGDSNGDGKKKQKDKANAAMPRGQLLPAPQSPAVPSIPTVYGFAPQLFSDENPNSCSIM